MPARTQAWAVARPMPRPAPVIAMTRPSSGCVRAGPAGHVSASRLQRTVIVGRWRASVTPGTRSAYTEYGSGGRTVVLIHGLLLSQRMHEPLARALAQRGNHVVTLDLLGHGLSDRPLEPASYSTSIFGEQVIALLDHLAIDEAIVLGTSLGANTALEAAALAPARVRGMVIEMPVLDQALIACIVAFGPLMVGLAFAQPVARLSALAARAVPRRLLPFWGDIVLDTVRQDPAPSGAVLRGLFFGRVAPRPAGAPRDARADARHRPPPRPGASAQRRRARSPTSCPTGGCWRRRRSSSCA